MNMEDSVFYPTILRLSKIALFGFFSTAILFLSQVIPDNPFSFFPLLFIPFTLYIFVSPIVAIIGKKRLVINARGIFDSVSMISPSGIFWTDIRTIRVTPQHNRQFIEIQLKSLNDVLERESLIRKWFLKAALFDYTGKLNRTYIDPTLFATTAEALVQKIKRYATVSVESLSVVR